MDLPQPFVSKSDKWIEAREVLDGEEKEDKLGVLSLDGGVIINGERRDAAEADLHLGLVEKLRGSNLVIPSDISGELINNGAPSYLSFEDRNDAGFYVGSNGGHSAEVKYDEDVPDNEPWHSHSCLESYTVKGGEAIIGLSYSPQNTEFNKKIIEEGETLTVGPYVPHKLLETDEDPDLAIVRYSSEGQIAKYGPEGNQMYSWLEDYPEYVFEPAAVGENVIKTNEVK